MERLNDLIPILSPNFELLGDVFLSLNKKGNLFFHFFCALFCSFNFFFNNLLASDFEFGFNCREPAHKNKKQALYMKHNKYNNI